MEYICLGSNCSITYQLNKFGLRTHAYPFDWSKISLHQLIDILTNNFCDFTESIEFKKISQSHPIIIDTIDTINTIDNKNNSSSIIVSNKYGIIFAHELSSKYQLDEFKEKIKIRIEMFNNLSSNQNKIKFIRIELSPIKISWSNQIFQLIYLLNMIISSSQYELILIINSSFQYEFPSNVKIFNYNDFSSDWKMDGLEWTKIFNL